MTQRPSGVHERGAVRLEMAERHHLVERVRRLVHLVGRRAVARVDLGDDAGHAPEHVTRSLDRLEGVVLPQVATGEHGARIVRERCPREIRRRGFEVCRVRLSVYVGSDRGVRLLQGTKILQGKLG